CRWVGEWTDDFAQIPKRPRPPMGQNERHRLWAFTWFMNEVDRNILDCHLIVRECIHLLFLFSPVIALTPVGDEFFQISSAGAVLPIVIGEIIRPAHMRQTFAKVSERGLGNSNSERGFLHE